MRDEQVDPNQNYRPEDLTITDPSGVPLPEDHPAVANPQVGRPFSKGDLTLPENQELAEALASQDRRTVRRGSQTETEPVQAVAPAAPAAPATAPVVSRVGGQAQSQPVQSTPAVTPQPAPQAVQPAPQPTGEPNPPA